MGSPREHGLRRRLPGKPWCRLKLVLSNTEFGPAVPCEDGLFDGAFFVLLLCLLGILAASGVQRSRVALVGLINRQAIVVAVFTLTRGTAAAVLVGLAYFGCGLLFLIHGWLAFRSSA